jgi:hypothetical protein
MKWEKLGQVFQPNNQYKWVKTHAMLPTVDHVEGDIFRIYFSGRDAINISRIGYLDININEPQKIIYLSENPIVDIGKLGSFDDNGISPTCIINYNDKKYFYIMGWNKGSKVRAAEVSGLTISSNNGVSFEKYSNAPVLDRTDKEPYTILVVSCIIIENGIWRMWYDSADYWINEELPRYNIKYAESTDGINWKRDGIISVDYQNNEETRVSRASILKEDGIYKMWHCYAIGNGGYKMSYAESEDGFIFKRMHDKVGIELSETGWDSEMICYPNIFKHKNEIYMLYCGNGYGKSGFGIAKLIK